MVFMLTYKTHTMHTLIMHMYHQIYIKTTHLSSNNTDNNTICQQHSDENKIEWNVPSIQIHAALMIMKA